MHIHPRLLLAVVLVSAMVPCARAAEGSAAAAPASGPAPKLHCVVLNEASGATPNTEIIVQTIGAAGWVPVSGETTGRGGACDLAFPGDVQSPLMLRVIAPGYKETDVLYMPDPSKVIPWLTITLKGAMQLSGTVVDGDDQPVADAEVTLDMPAGPRRTKTDAEGRFLLEELMPTRTTVRVEVSGIGSATYRVDLRSQTEPLKIMLRPQRKVSLRVVDGDNEPVANLKLQVLAPREVEATTDADGQIRIHGVGGNATQIRVRLMDKFYCFDEPELTFDIDDGGEPVELQVYVSHGGRICGRVVEVVDGEAWGIAAASVWLVDQGRIGQSVECDEDGRFEMDGVPPDSYALVAGHMTYAASLGKVEVEAGREAVVDFTLVSGATVRGTVVDPQGKPAARAIVRVAGWYPERRGRDEIGPIELPMRATRTNDQGQFALEYLPVGRLLIEAGAEDGSNPTATSVQVEEGQEVVEANLSLRTDQDRPPL